MDMRPNGMSDPSDRLLLVGLTDGPPGIDDISGAMSWRSRKSHADAVLDLGSSSPNAVLN
jgi:hypothetical protein